ncbi:uncharacterized protein SEPMUDRAFT_83884 [Sphaerulina musiva SO2202]|uniref:Uncharacterized protein n=1 Tax=Sphaerulina musiva (strain SO2202) TaxID=692275 RepID=M3BYT9_SPHMS|nr:uncharacterized protein SEPMUDRAFT_83884 [Sphaerulina musiva SO2202]EMF13241.1 hypothetical protein SEPMUDRAFT_83884 [Sphaerulina musiva SO2202]
MQPFEMVAGGGDRPFPGPRIGIPALFLLLLLLLLYLLHLRFPVLMEREKESGASLLPDKKRLKIDFVNEGIIRVRIGFGNVRIRAAAWRPSGLSFSPRKLHVPTLSVHRYLLVGIGIAHDHLSSTSLALPTRSRLPLRQIDFEVDDQLPARYTQNNRTIFTCCSCRCSVRPWRETV